MYSSYQNWLGGSETLWQISGMLLCKRNPPHCLFGGHCYDFYIKRKDTHIILFSALNDMDQAQVKTVFFNKFLMFLTFEMIPGCYVTDMHVWLMRLIQNLPVN